MANDKLDLKNLAAGAGKGAASLFGKAKKAVVNSLIFIRLTIITVPIEMYTPYQSTGRIRPVGVSLKQRGE